MLQEVAIVRVLCLRNGDHQCITGGGDCSSSVSEKWRQSMWCWRWRLSEFSVLNIESRTSLVGGQSRSRGYDVGMTGV